MEYVISNRMKDMKGSAIREIFKYAADPDIISLAGGNPHPDTFPSAALASLANEILTKEPVRALQYGITEGYPELRELVKKRLEEKEKIFLSDNENLIIVSGGQQGIDLTLKTLVNEGDIVLTEEPSFIGTLNAIRSFGAVPVGVPMEDDGIDTEALEEKIENCRPKALYTIPTFQNPTGITMSEKKRKEVLEICKKHNVVIIEDNPYGELYFGNKKHLPIKSMDDSGVVVYCGSFSKILSPGLRLGFVLGANEIISKNIIAKQTEDVHTPMLTQMIAAEYLKRYDIDANTERSRILYRHKKETMVEAIRKFFPKDVSYTDPDGGLFLWCDMKNGKDSAEFVKECIKNKVVFVPGSTFMCDMNKKTSTFRLNYSTVDDDKITKGIEIIGKVMKTF